MAIIETRSGADQRPRRSSKTGQARARLGEFAERNLVHRLPAITALMLVPGTPPGHEAVLARRSDDDLRDDVMREAFGSLQRSLATTERTLDQNRRSNAEIEVGRQQIDRRLGELDRALQRLIGP